jgi:HSP20 family protein
VPRRHVPSTHVLATFDDTLDDFRRRFTESFWEPWEWPAIEPYVGRFPMREAFSDLIDTGDKYLVRAEVPGIPKDQIDVTVTKDGIEISAETGAEKEEKERNFIVRERSHSSIYKSFVFPAEVIPEKAEPTLKDEVLEVSIPKMTSTPEPKKHKVEVKEAT